MVLNYGVLSKKMMSRSGLKSHAELAKALGVTPQALSNSKKRGEMPPRLIFRFSKIYGVSLDWLVNDAEDAGPRESGCEYPQLSLDSLTAINEYEREYVNKLLLMLRLSGAPMLNIVKLCLETTDAMTYGRLEC